MSASIQSDLSTKNKVKIWTQYDPQISGYLEPQSFIFKNLSSLCARTDRERSGWQKVTHGRSDRRKEAMVLKSEKQHNETGRYNSDQSSLMTISVLRMRMERREDDEGSQRGE